MKYNNKILKEFDGEFGVTYNIDCDKLRNCVDGVYVMIHDMSHLLIRNYSQHYFLYNYVILDILANMFVQ